MRGTMSRRCRNRNKSPDEDETSINKELSVLGMLEDGMSLKDKQTLLKIVRNSESTAQEEEKDRARCNTENQKVSTSESSDLDILPKLVKKDENSHSSPEKSQTIVGEQDNQRTSRFSKKNPKSPACMSDEEFNIIVLNHTKESVGKVELKTVKEIDETQIDPLSSSESELSFTMPSTKDYFKDKRRNINVFCPSNDSCEFTFKRRQMRRVCDRFPFYLLSENMDLQKFTLHFKRHVDSYLRRLEEIQNRSVNIIPWSDPIQGPAFSLTHTDTRSDFEVVDCNETRTSTRYNFRCKLSKRKQRGDDTANFLEDLSDEDLFLCKRKKSTKTKKNYTSKKNGDVCKDCGTDGEQLNNLESDLSREPFKSLKSEENIGSVSSYFQRFETNSSKAPSPEYDSQEKYSIDFCVTSEGENESKEKTVGTKTSPSISNSQEKPVQQSDIFTQTSKISKERIVRNRPPVKSPVRSSVSPSVQTPSCSANKVENAKLCEPQQISQPSALRPAPFSVKKRRLEMQESAAERKIAMRELEDKDVSVVFEGDKAELTVETVSEDKIPCPICRQIFPATDIEEHASECNQYSDYKEGDVSGTNRITRQSSRR